MSKGTKKFSQALFAVVAAVTILFAVAACSNT
jgi:hypothetical protein